MPSTDILNQWRRFVIAATQLRETNEKLLIAAKKYAKQQQWEEPTTISQALELAAKIKKELEGK